MDLTTIDRPLSRDLDVLRCPGCGRALQPANETPITDGEMSLRCDRCDETFPVIDGVPRMLLTPMREAMMASGPHDGADTRQVATARSFGFEWSRFPEMRDEWERNFLEYMAPHGPDFFHGKRALDAGCGSGRHAYHAARYGAEVWAIDLGPAVEIARRNTAGQGSVHVVQADLYKPPFAPESFDFIYSLGVLHHLPDPEDGFRNLLQYLRPGGEIQIYLYWEPEGQPFKKLLLAVTSAVRQITTHLSHEAVYILAYPAAWLAFGLFVWPYLALRCVPGLRGLVERMPMKQYARYPFRVCVNDQFDRLSAPIENRYTKAEVKGWLARAGLEDVTVRPNCGWVATGRKPGLTIG